MYSRLDGMARSSPCVANKYALKTAGVSVSSVLLMLLEYEVDDAFGSSCPSPPIVVVVAVVARALLKAAA